MSSMDDFISLLEGGDAESGCGSDEIITPPRQMLKRLKQT